MIFALCFSVQHEVFIPVLSVNALHLHPHCQGFDSPMLGKWQRRLSQPRCSPPLYHGLPGKRNTCSHLSSGKAKPANFLRARDTARVVAGSPVAGEARRKGVASPWPQHSMSWSLLVSVSSTGSEGGSGSWGFIKRLIVVSGAEILLTTVPA